MFDRDVFDRDSDMCDTDDAGLAEAARTAQVWAYPLLFAQRVRLNFVQPLAPLNTFGHQRRPSDPTLTVGVAPNVDTLYSVAWLDVRHNDVALELPDVDGRYASFQLALQDTSTPITLTTPAPGHSFPTVSITSGPDELVVSDEHVALRTSWRYVMVVGRILIEPGAAGAGTAETELAAVHRLQDAITLRCTPVSQAPAPSVDQHLARLTREDETLTPHVFMTALRQVLTDIDGHDPADPAAAADPGVHAPLRRLLGAAGTPRADADCARGLRTGLDDIAAHVRTLGRRTGGWAVNESGAAFGDDHLLRATVAHAQIFVNPASEALYPVCEVDVDGEPLDGSAHAYRLTFDGGAMPPVGAFWSLTAYHARGLLVDNEIGRYAIGDRTPGLTYRPDGSLTIDIRATRPESAGNWLPVPEGPFRLMLRLYHPATTMWDPPPVVPVPG